MNNYTYIIIIILIIIIFIAFVRYINNINNIESFADNNFSKNIILKDCIDNYAKNSNSGTPEQFCKSNAWVTNPQYLCGICGADDLNPLYSFLSNDQKLFGCSQNATNSMGLSWGIPTNNNVNTINSILGNLQTCNTFNSTAKSNMYIYVCCDDECTVSLNNNVIITQSSWNKLGVYLVQNVNFGDVISINGTNVCGPGGICVSYIWNGQLFILDNNGFEKCANIINYKLSLTKTWSNIWSTGSVAQLPPWMNNWITLPNVPNCGQGSTTGILSFKIGDTQKKDLLNNDLTVILGIDDSGTVYLNDNLVYNKTSASNIIDTFTIPNVNNGDILKFNCVNYGGPSGIGLTYLWCGMLFTLPSSLSQFNTVANIISYSSTNCNTMSYNCSGVVGNLQFVTNWLNSGAVNFSLTTTIGENGYQYPPSINNWYTLIQNNNVGKWSITNITSNLNMIISFDLNITTIVPSTIGYRNILHLTNDNNNWQTIGSRIAAIWVEPNNSSLLIQYGATGEYNVGSKAVSTTNIPLNTSTNVKIIFSGPTLIVYLNSVLSSENTFPLPLTTLATPNAYFYIGDPWYTQDGGVQIKNFKITNSSNNSLNGKIENVITTGVINTQKYIDQRSASKNINNNNIINALRNEGVNKGVNEIKKLGNEGVNEIKKLGNEGVNEIKKLGNEGVNEIKKQGNKGITEIKKLTNQGIKSIKKVFKKK